MKAAYKTYLAVAIFIIGVVLLYAAIKSPKDDFQFKIITISAFGR